LPGNLAHAEDECLAAPNEQAPEGSHWYFRSDRATRRKCWFLGTQGTTQGMKHRPVARAASPAAKRPAAPPSTPAVASTQAEPEPKAPTPIEPEAKTDEIPQSSKETSETVGMGSMQVALSAPAIDQPIASVLFAPASMVLSAADSGQPPLAGANSQPSTASANDQLPAATANDQPAPVRSSPPPARRAAIAKPPESSLRLATMLVFVVGAFASCIFAGRAMLKHAGSPLKPARRAPFRGWQ
jgi:hypothetical protein